MQCLQICNRVSPEQPLLVQIVLHPQVFADGDTEAPKAAITFQLQQAGLVGRAEVAPFIEHVVAGQQALAGHNPPAAVLHESSGVEQIGGLPILRGLAHPQQQGQPLGEFGGKPVQRDLLLLAQGRAQQQIARWIAPQRQLRRHHQINAGRRGAAAGLQQLLAIAGQVAHQRVDLGEGETHQRGEWEGCCPRP